MIRRIVKFSSLAISLATISCGKPTDGPAPPPAGGATMQAPQVPKATNDAGADIAPADVKFMQGMIAHHAQALVMAAMAPTHGASDKVALFCKKVNMSQGDEIKLMQAWLKMHNQTVPDPKDTKMMSMPEMMMPGMLTDAQMKQLDAARGPVFDSLFLTFMIQHHEGAIKMVADLFAAGAGQESEIGQYATGVDVDQRGEIDRMQTMLNSAKGSHSQ